MSTMTKSPQDQLRELGDHIREQRRQAELSMRKLADLAGVSNPYLSQIERGLKRPSAEILQQIAHALQVSAESLYVRAGILDAERDLDLLAAIRSQADLSSEQKQVLIRIYTSFLAENGVDESSADASSDVG
jgi:transcriptional regulator with XRE-family HTH domain